MADVLKPYTEHAISQQVAATIALLQQLSSTYNHYVNTIIAYYNANIKGSYKGSAASQINDQINTLTTYAPPRIDLPGPGSLGSNLHQLISALQQLTHDLEDKGEYYDRTNDNTIHSFLGIGGMFETLESVASNHHTNEDYARYILRVMHGDYSHPLPIDPILHYGLVGVEAGIEGWTPEDSKNQDLGYREDIRTVLYDWASDIRVIYFQFASRILVDITAAILHPGGNTAAEAAIPLIQMGKFEQQMSYAELYDRTAAAENDDDAHDKVGITPITLTGGKKGILVTLPGTQLSKLSQANGPLDGLAALFDTPNNPYTQRAIQDIQSYLKDNGLPANTPIVLGGHSLGGMVAQQIEEQAPSLGFNINEVITFGSPYVYGLDKNPQVLVTGAALPPMPVPSHMFYNQNDFVTNLAGRGTISSTQTNETATYNPNRPLPSDTVLHALDTHDYSASIQIDNGTSLQDQHVDFTVNGSTKFYDLGGIPQQIAGQLNH